MRDHTSRRGAGRVAEDEPTVFDFVRMALEGAGYFVLAARDGQEALAIEISRARAVAPGRPVGPSRHEQDAHSGTFGAQLLDHARPVEPRHLHVVAPAMTA